MADLSKARNQKSVQQNSRRHFKEFKTNSKLCVVRHTWNPRPREVEPGGWQIPSHPGLSRKTQSPKQPTNQNSNVKT